MTAETKWVPGPWRFVKDADNVGDSEWVLGSVKGKTAPDEGEYHIARVWKDAPNATQNARLIAAAPELYEALAAYHAANRIHNDAEDALYTLSEAALAKARGETP